MRGSRRTLCLSVVVSAAAVLLFSPAAVVAEPVSWFNPSGGKHGYKSFADLQAAYDAFLDPGLRRIDFGLLADGVKLGKQYQADYGVTFLNTGGGRYDAYSGVRPEGGAYVENLTGYDGAYMPDGDKVYLKFDNNLPASPFTILFDQPVSQVGSFLAVGKEGSVHSLAITAYDVAGRILGRQVIDTWLWDKKDDKQNFESFFGLRADGPMISRVEILNDSCTDFSNALVVDNLTFGKAVPEPISLAFLTAGAFTLCRRRHRL